MEQEKVDKRVEQYDKIVKSSRETFELKNRTYGDSFFIENKEQLFDAFSNLRRKFARVEETLQEHNFDYPPEASNEEKEESLMNQLEDIINYSVMTGIRVKEHEGEFEDLTPERDTGDSEREDKKARIKKYNLDNFDEVHTEIIAALDENGGEASTDYIDDELERFRRQDIQNGLSRLRSFGIISSDPKLKQHSLVTTTIEVV